MPVEETIAAVRGMCTEPMPAPSSSSVAVAASPSRSMRTATVHGPLGSATSETTRVCSWKWL